MASRARLAQPNMLAASSSPRTCTWPKPAPPALSRSIAGVKACTSTIRSSSSSSAVRWKPSWAAGAARISARHAGAAR